jgi:tryptophanyl-tRNA synthetase
MTTKKRILSGVQPTSGLHLGNYLGAIRNWVALQTDYDSFFFAGDMHSITLRQDPKALRENTYTVVATYLACGIDPAKSTIFVQSQVPEHAELAWVLTCFSNMGELGRMTQFKDKSRKQTQSDSVPTGLFVYPTLMAADILLYQAHLVPVGEDQKQHLEITRDLAERLNKFAERDLFVVPNVFTPPTGGRVMSLLDPEAKMSKSDENPQATIFLNDDDTAIVKKFKRAVTDSKPAIDESEPTAGVKNLFAIQAACKGTTIEAVHKSYVGRQYGYLKVETADVVVTTLRPIRERMRELLGDRAELDRLLAQGAEKAQAVAARTLADVYDAVGFLTPRRAGSPAKP